MISEESFIDIGGTLSNYNLDQIKKKLQLTVLNKKISFKEDSIFKEDLFYTDSIYTGQIKDRKRSGIGILFLSNNRYYHGMWEDDYPHGQGVLKCDDFKYEGEFNKGAFHGYGEYKKDGYLYKGSWEMNKKSGIGREFINNNEVYEGSFSNNIRNGKGYLTRRGITLKVLFDKGNLIKGTIENTDKVVTYYWNNRNLEKISLEHLNSIIKVEISSDYNAKLIINDNRDRHCSIKYQNNMLNLIIRNNH